MALSSVTQFTRIDTCEVSECSHGASTSYLPCSQVLSMRPRRNTLRQEAGWSIRASREAHGAPRADEHSDPSAGRARAITRSRHAPRCHCRRSARSWSTSAAAHAAESTMQCCSACAEFVTPCPAGCARLRSHKAKADDSRETKAIVTRAVGRASKFSVRRHAIRSRSSRSWSPQSRNTTKGQTLSRVVQSYYLQSVRCPVFSRFL